MSVKFTGNSKQVLSQMERNIHRALTAMGLTAVKKVQDTMENKYGRPIYQSGDLIRSISHNTRMNEKVVDVGSPQDYAPHVHEGTARMAGRPFLKDGIMENKKTLQEVAEMYLKQGF